LLLTPSLHSSHEPPSASWIRLCLRHRQQPEKSQKGVDLEVLAQGALIMGWLLQISVTVLPCKDQNTHLGGLIHQPGKQDGNVKQLHSAPQTLGPAWAKSHVSCETNIRASAHPMVSSSSEISQSPFSPNRERQPFEAKARRCRDPILCSAVSMYIHDPNRNGQV
jgi:hypothetical protein